MKRFILLLICICHLEALATEDRIDVFNSASEKKATQDIVDPKEIIFAIRNSPNKIGDMLGFCDSFVVTYDHEERMVSKCVTANRREMQGNINRYKEIIKLALKEKKAPWVLLQPFTALLTNW